MTSDSKETEQKEPTLKPLSEQVADFYFEDPFAVTAMATAYALVRDDLQVLAPDLKEVPEKIDAKRFIAEAEEYCADPKKRKLYMYASFDVLETSRGEAIIDVVTTMLNQQGVSHDNTEFRNGFSRLMLVYVSNNG